MTTKQALNILHPENNTPQTLKQAYRQACLKHHPDLGGDENMMKVINEAMEILRKCSWTPNECREASKDSPLTDEMADLWNKIKTWPGLAGEIVGTWIWVTGDTRKYRKELKSLGLKWSNNKTAWYWHPAGYRKRSKRSFEMNDIRTMFGTTELKTETA